MSEENLYTFENEAYRKTYWHTCSHVMAQAVKRLYPQVKLAIGPSIDNGFYYDFDVEKPFSPEDLSKIEAEMKKIVKENIPLQAFTLSPEDALQKLADMGEPYKVELCEEHAGKSPLISFYEQADFTDLCAGPHLMSTGAVKAFKLTSSTGAYWRDTATASPLSSMSCNRAFTAGRMEATWSKFTSICFEARTNSVPAKRSSSS